MTTHRARITGCEEALRHLATYLDGELADAVGEEVEEHLARCRSCYSRAEFERRLKEQVAASGHESVRPQLKNRVRTVVQNFQLDGSEGEPGPEGEPEGARKGEPADAPGPDPHR